MDVSRLPNKVLYFYDSFAEWMYNNQLVTVAVLVAAVLVGCGVEVGRTYYKQWLLRTAGAPTRRGHVATRKARDRYVSDLLAEDIIYAVESRVWMKDITREEANKQYAALASMLRNKDLYPKSNLLKIMIKERLSTEFYKLKPLTHLDGNAVVVPSPTAEVIDFGSKLRNRSAA